MAASCNTSWQTSAGTTEQPSVWALTSRVHVAEPQVLELQAVAEVRPLAHSCAVGPPQREALQSCQAERIWR